MRENYSDLVLTIGSEKRDRTPQERERFGELLVQMLGEQPEVARLLPREHHLELVNDVVSEATSNLRAASLRFHILADV